MKTIVIAAVLLLAAGSILGQTTDTQTQVTTAVPGSPEMKSGNTALLYSILLPGGGQFYNGETTKGLIQLGGTVVGLILFVAYFPSEDFVRDDYYWASYGYWTEEGNAGLSYGGLAVALGCRIWSLVDAPAGAKRFNQKHGLASIPLGDGGLYVAVDNLKVNQRNTLGLKLGLSF